MMTGTLQGRHVFGCIAAFFAVVTAVNGIFIYFALSSWSGLTAPDAYNRGIAYNRVLDEAAAQARLGWRAEIGWRKGTAEARLVDRDGSPLDGLAVAAHFARPLGKGEPLDVALVATAPGRYVAAIDLPLPGQWEMQIEARGAAGRYQAATRLIVP